MSGSPTYLRRLERRSGKNYCCIRKKEERQRSMLKIYDKYFNIHERSLHEF
jgi:hypothetical protein